MPDTARSIISEFQRRHADRRKDPRLQGFSGSYRFDVEGVGSWRVEVHDEIATMTESTAAADCAFRCTEADFVRIARGEQNLLTAFLQGRVQLEGDYALAQRWHSLIRTVLDRAA